MIPVEPRQAGETLHCDCGETIQSPTMLEMASLGRSEPAPSGVAPSRGWGWPERLILMGGAVLAGALVAALVLFGQRPEAPPRWFAPEIIAHHVQRLTPLQSIQFFHDMAGAGLDPAKLPAEQVYETRMQVFQGWLGFFAILGAAGLIVVGVGAWGRSRTRKT